MPSPLLIARSAAVVGGGLVGLACAINLQRAGFATTLIDPDSSRQAASWGNAGHIATEQVEPLASWKTVASIGRRLYSRGGAVGLPPRDLTAWLPFALRLLAASRPSRFRAGKAALSDAVGAALPAWRRLLEVAEASALLREEGHFVVWETPARAAAGRAAWARIDTGTATFREATRAELDRLAEIMSRPPAGAIRFEGTGQIEDLPLLGDALTDLFAKLGGNRLRARADAIRLEGDRATVIAGGERLEADAVIIAAGAESAALLSPIEGRIPLIAERGYHVETAATDWPADLPPVVFEDRSMIVTRFRSGLRAASFVEFGRAASPPDAGKWQRLRAHIAGLGLSFGGPVREWMGARPTLPDYLPAIGRSRKSPNLYYAFGHQHLGLTLAATTGEAMAALVTGTAAPIDLAPFDLQRFRWRMR